MEKEEESKDMVMSPKQASSTPAAPTRPRKRSGALGLLRAVLFVTRQSTSKKVAPAQANEVVRSGRTSFWKSLVAGVRPLHHHQLEHQEVAPPEPVAALPLTKVDYFHEVFTPATSPLHSSVDGMSRYASAEDLHALDTGEDGKRDAEKDGGDDRGDAEPNEIDVKAEEFIARFYEQQLLESIALQG
ncbi:uncharacterized protein LOC103720045 [Phoenix dactylifera]|uniref:Uncharacterized protein LOC103720045 n=1 Tax=Phoenix dactylifera TaxID=42345 RepID=A0A8B7CWQ6_PHODC|nr:uncharacterized protein LOC103720045 [Phoenix dactylifera]